MLSFLSVETCLSPVTATICQVLSFLVYDHQIQSTRLNWMIGLEITYEVYLILIIFLGQLQVRVNIICLHVRWQITFTILIHLWSYYVEILSNFFTLSLLHSLMTEFLISTFCSLKVAFIWALQKFSASLEKRSFFNFFYKVKKCLSLALFFAVSIYVLLKLWQSL